MLSGPIRLRGVVHDALIEEALFLRELLVREFVPIPSHEERV